MLDHFTINWSRFSSVPSFPPTRWPSLLIQSIYNCSIISDPIMYSVFVVTTCAVLLLFLGQGEACICTADFKPVCCKTKAGQLETQPNACSCNCIGGTVHADGECKNCFCPLFYNPVCCDTVNGLETKTNACACSCSNGRFVSEGECPHVVETPEPEPCACFEIYQPVCCKNESGLSIASNKCVCKCDGGSVFPLSDCFAQA